MNDFLRDLSDRFYEGLLEFIPDLVVALTIAVIGWVVAKFLQLAINRFGDNRGWDHTVSRYLGTAVRYFAVVVAFIAALSRAGFPVSSFLVMLGVSGVIIGFGARASLQNYFAGLMILGAHPFKTGDLIEYGQPPYVGRVTKVAMTYTALATLDNVHLVVPNAVMWGNRIHNFSRYDYRSIRVPMSTSYDTDIDWVRDLALDILRRHEAVLDEPSPSVTVSDVTPERVNLLLVANSRVETMNVFGDVVTQLRSDFKTAGLEVMVPARDVDLKREE